MISTPQDSFYRNQFMNSSIEKFADVLGGYFGDASIIDGSQELSFFTSQNPVLHEEIEKVFDEINNLVVSENQEVLEVFRSNVFIENFADAQLFLSELKENYETAYTKLTQ
jgi:hypothetical protein